MTDGLATVTSITTTHKMGADGQGQCIDIVALTCDAKAYSWETEPLRYTVGQVVRVYPPLAPGLCIRPALDVQEGDSR